MPKETFLYPESKPVFELIEEASRRSGVSRGQAFEDFLHMSVCALSGGQMEEQYLETVKKHTAGEAGKRGCDSISHAFGKLVAAMEETRKDILGDIFQGGITYGEAGQFLTPEPVCDMMARMAIEGVEVETGDRKSVCDPCCGSGRMLLAAGEMQPGWEFVGQDIDLRCVRMTAINLALRNLYGYVIWGNSLGSEKRIVYRTGFDLRGVIREVPIAACSDAIRKLASEPTKSLSLNETGSNDDMPRDQVPDDAPQKKAKPPRQGTLF
jgi:N-6 DNA Methylase